MRFSIESASRPARWSLLGATLLAFCVPLLAQRQLATPVPTHGDRILAVTINEAADGDYDAAAQRALAIGAEATSLPVFWDDIEVAPYVYAPNPDWLSIANAYYPGIGLKLCLEVNPIDTNQLRVPADLVGVPFDSAQMIQRYNALVDFVFSRIPDIQLVSFSIGNEIDAYLGTDATLWARYTTFFAATSAHVRTRRSGLVVGAKSTHDGLTGAALSPLWTLNQHADGLFATYYPLNGDFTVQDPSVVLGDLWQLVFLYPDRPIYLMEAGFPTSPLCNSSDLQQAQFVRQLFRSWDLFHDRIRLMDFTWMHDLSPQAVADLGNYYGISDPVFLEYLRTLGLRTHAGPGLDKPGWTTLATEAASRGW